MPTKIFYKEIQDPADPTEKIPVPIDDLFLPKKRLGDKVPKNKETGITDIGIDISNLFEIADRKTLPTLSMIGGERTNLYVSTADKDYTYGLFIKSVSTSYTRIYSTGYAGDIAANLTIPVTSLPRWRFYKTVAQYGPHQCVSAAGLIPPNVDSYQIKSPNVRGAEYLRVDIHVDVHELTEESNPDGPVLGAYVDLSEIYASKAETFPTDKWWVPYLFMNGDKYAINYYDDENGSDRNFLVTGLPKGELEWVVIGGQWYHSNFTSHFWAAGTKEEGSTSVSFSFGSAGYAWVFGMPLPS